MTLTNSILGYFNQTRIGRAFLSRLIYARYKQRGKDIREVRYLPQFRAWEFTFNDLVFLSSGPGWIYDYDYLVERLKSSVAYNYFPKKGDIVVDIGAGVGEETIVLSSIVGNEGKVFSIEAHPKTFEALRYAVEANKLNNVELFNIALSDTPGTVFIEDVENSLANSISSSPAPDSFEVNSETFDNFVERNNIKRIDLLKMNVEGAEQLIIKGMKNSINRIRNFSIFCHDFRFEQGESEFFKTRDIVLDFFKENNFEIITKTRPDNTIHDDVYAVNKNFSEADV